MYKFIFMNILVYYERINIEPTLKSSHIDKSYFDTNMKLKQIHDKFSMKKFGNSVHKKHSIIKLNY